MGKIVKQREIMDRRALWAILEKEAAWSGYSSKMRPFVLEQFKNVLASGRVEIQKRFEDKKANGIVTFHNYSFLIDQIVRVLYDFTTQYVTNINTPTKGEQFAIAAVGGYGRSEMAPQSDIDLLFLLPYKQTPKVEQSIEFMLYLLWDLGLKVGHATRNIDECIKLSKEDLTIQTALMDARFLWGNLDLFTGFQDKFRSKFINSGSNDFVEAKLEERDQRHKRMGDTRYVVEPNLKEGKGGLRDLQTLYWIAKNIYGVERWRELVSQAVITPEDAKLFKKSVNFLFTVRCALHYQTNRAQENLTFDVQYPLAEHLGYRDHAGTSGVERFMKHYYLTAKTVGDLTRNLCAVLEEQQKKQHQHFALLTNMFKKNIEGFELDSGRLRHTQEGFFSEDPLQILRVFQLAQEHDLDIHPFTLREIHENLKLINAKYRKDPKANEIFIEILTSLKEPQRILRMMGEIGVFGKFIPDFGRVTAQMQYDMYHTYTVDEHTIKAIGELNKVETGKNTEELPVSSNAINDVLSRRALYVAVMMHDIAKGRGGDHSVIGAELCQKLCPRLGLSAEETETVAWLVLNHLLMSNVAFKRDLEDPSLIKQFCETVQSPERLRLLLILTVCDIRAVGPDIWNGWKGNLLRTLYSRAMEILTGGEAAAGGISVRVDEKKNALREELADLNLVDLDQFIDLGNNSYWLTYDTASHMKHYQLYKASENEEGPIYIDVDLDTFNGINEITVYMGDHPGLFSVIAGAMALSNGSIVDAKISTLSNGMAMDTFSIQDNSGEAFSGPEKIQRFKERINKILIGDLSIQKELDKINKATLKSRREVFTVPPRVLVDNSVSKTYTVIEVNGRDRLGFLFDVTHAVRQLGLQISSAHISTYGERAVDVFYVKDVFGLKINSESKIAEIKKKIMDTLSPKRKKTSKKLSSSTEAAE